MKRFFFLLVTLFCCCFSWMSCSGDDNKGSGNAGSNTDEPDIPVSISLSKEALEFDSNSGYQTIVVTSSDKWTMTGDESWCRVTPTEGKSGETVTITVDTNESIEDRSTTFTFTCGNKSVKLSVLQYGLIETSYVELNLDADETTVAYSEQTGETVVTYNSGTVPDAEIGQAFVLTDEFNYDIRKITGVSKQGNKLILQTEQGDMCDLFMNIDFTLTTNPDLVADARSAGRVITPNSVEVIAGGKRTVIYEKPVVMSREVFTYPHELFRLEDDFAGDKLADGEWGEVTWEEGNYDIGLDAVFFFDFGEKEVNKAKEGDLKKFRYYLDGNVDVDLLLKYETQKEYTFEKKEITRKNVIPTVTVEFMVGTIPVVVTLDTDYGTRINAVCEAGLEASAGLYLHSEAHVGLEWTKGKGITPIESFTNEYGVYDPTLNIQGSAEADFAFFPRLQFKLYKCLGPWVDLIPYMKVGAEAGAQVTLGGHNYCSWGFGVSSGLDATVGMELDMGIFDLEFFDPIDIPCMETLLFEAPQQISLQSPDNDYEMNVGEEVEITFLVESKNYLLDEYWACAGAVVQFETNGDIENNFALTDESGMVEVNWTPLTENDKLVAKIVDKEGEVISQAEFNPKKAQNEGGTILTLLRTVYNQTGGDNWTHKDNWFSDLPFDNWEGVFVTGEGRVSLSLGYNNLVGELKINASNGGALLEALSCEGNQLTSLDVSGCSSLSTLYCDDNQLSYLDVSGTSLEGHWISGVYEFKNNPLSFLDVSNTSLDYLMLDEIISPSLRIVGGTNLNQLRFDNCELGSLDVSGCTSLNSLNGINNLSSLDVSGCTSLTGVHVENSPLSFLNASNSSLCTVGLSGVSSVSLKIVGLNQPEGMLSINSENSSFTLLDISEGVMIHSLDISEHNSTSLKIVGPNQPEEMLRINSENSSFTLLDISEGVMIDFLDISEHNSTSLKIVGDKIIGASVKGHLLTTLDVSGCSLLEYVNFDDNPLSSLDITGCQTLKDLEIKNLKSSSFEIVGGASLNSLVCKINQLTTLDISSCTSLSGLDCSSAQLTSLDVSGLSFLKSLDCSNNQITSLNVSGCTALEELKCHNNPLSLLDVTGCSIIKSLEFQPGELGSSSFKIVGGTSLEYLKFSGNSLTSLDVSSCRALVKLECGFNQLTSLKVSGCTALEELECWGNQLTSLNVSGFVALKKLECSGNQLTSLNVSGCTALRELGCSENKINSEIPNWFSQLEYFTYDVKYEYWDEQVDDDTWVRKHRDKGYGWWYPGEPGKGRHDPY